MADVPLASLVRVAVGGGSMISAGVAFLRAGHDGTIDGPEHGLFVDETRLISRWRWRIPERELRRVAASSVEQHVWHAYLLATPPAIPDEPDPMAVVMGDVHADVGIEVHLARRLGEGLHEDVTVTNWSMTHARFELVLDVDADFASLEQARNRRPPRGTTRHRWSRVDVDTWELAFAWVAEVAWSHQGQVGVTLAEREARVRVTRAGSPPTFADGAIRFALDLPPKGVWRACLEVDAGADGGGWSACPPSTGTTRLSLGAEALPVIAASALDRARQDLASLRLRTPEGDTYAAGAPLYVALFGRDALTASWQAALLDPEPMVGALRSLAAVQGQVVDTWRDEEPGKLLHERHGSPAEVLHDRPMDRYYGSITTSAFFPVVVGQAWHWLGDDARLRATIEPALSALHWLDVRARREDGFYVYRTHSAQGVRHQAWKDSPAAVVRADGTDVAPPCATVEEQAFVHLAKLQLALVLTAVGRRAEARRLRREADELADRVREAFWMEDERYLAMALDADGRKVDAIASNAGHGLAAGILVEEHVRAVADRLLSPELFSGWGVRTLSTDNPAYDPFSYHRGSVWPVENGTFVLGFVRYGLHDHAERLARVMFEASGLFPALRLPEVFSGHPRDAAHPFPAIYPDANPVQAWSASALICVLQALLGLYPYAPWRVLGVDPHLPAWLPRVRLDDLRVGDARVSLSFEREPSGRTSFRVDRLQGRLRVVRQPSPWSLTAGPLERARDVLESLKPQPRLRSRPRRRA